MAEVGAGTGGPPPSDGTVSDDYVSSLESRLSVMKHEIDALQIKALEAEKPWYKQASTIVAAIALLVSLVTGFDGIVRAQQAEVRDARVELRELIERIHALPREQVESNQLTQADTLGRAALTYTLEGERATLAKQAAAVVTREPEVASSREYLVVGQTLQAIGDPEALRFIDKALERAETPFERLGVLRGRAAYHYTYGNLDRGRQDFRQALEVLDETTFNVSLANAITYLGWAQWENTYGSCQHARAHLAEAAALLPNAVGIGADNPYQQQLVTITEAVEQRC